MAADDGVEIEQTKQMAALTARVAQLERQVAQLSRGPVPVEPPSAIPPIPPPPIVSWQPPPLASTLLPGVPPRFLADPMQEIPDQPTQSLESRLGSQVFNMIGIFAILIGTSWFLKLAIERGWIGPVARVLIGLASGAGLVLWSESFRRKGLAAFSYSLKAIGSAVLYLSLWAAFQLYHLLPAEVALVAMILVTAWNGFMAWTQDAELLAGYGLLGGFLTPLLLSSGGNHEAFLFTYIAAIDLAMILLMRWKPWHRLLLPAFGATAIYFAGWYAEFFHSDVRNTIDAESWETAAFVVLFFALFAAVSMRGFRVQPPDDAEVIVPVLLPLANAACMALALFKILQDSGLEASHAWLMVALAALYLGLMRLQATAVASAMHLACAVVFLTVAIPLRASGHTLTTAWLVEGLVLYWAATRVEQNSGAPARMLSVLSLAGYALGLASLALHWVWFNNNQSFFNANLGSAIIAVGVLAALAWLAMQSAHTDEQESSVTLFSALGAVDFVALILTWGEVSSTYFDTRHTAFANPEFATALVGLAVLAAIAWVSWRLSKTATGALSACASIAAVTLILFNVLAILSVEREIGALWPRSEAELQRSLAISAFLMLYGAVLLAAGFWRRSAFVRWQALILLVFTIGKVFFYDISGLSQGYRVASFLALGALLMAVSYAYQKDWLGLRPAAATPPEQAGGVQ